MLHPEFSNKNDTHYLFHQPSWLLQGSRYEIIPVDVFGIRIKYPGCGLATCPLYVDPLFGNLV